MNKLLFLGLCIALILLSVGVGNAINYNLSQPVNFNNLCQYYNFEGDDYESNQVNNSNGNINFSISTGYANVTSGLDGNSAYIFTTASLLDTNALFVTENNCLSSQNYTLSFWFKTNDTDVGTTTKMMYSQVGSGHYKGISILSNESLSFCIDCTIPPPVYNFATDLWSNFNINITDNEWHVFSIISDRSIHNDTLLIDGNYIISDDTFNHDLTEDKMFGDSGSSYSNAFSYSYYDEIRIYNITYDIATLISSIQGAALNFTFYNESVINEATQASYTINITNTTTIFSSLDYVNASFFFNNTQYAVSDLYFDGDHYVFETNFTVSSFPDHTSSFLVDSYWTLNFSSGANEYYENISITQTVDLDQEYNFRLLNEQTGYNFTVADTISTKMEVLCDNISTVVIDFSSTNNSFESTNITCSFDLIKVVTTYDTLGTYFRTLVPDLVANRESNQSIDFFMIDLNTDTAIERIMNIIDLTGDYQQGIMKLTRAVNGTPEIIIEQPFDVSDQTILYLIRDEAYVMSIINDAGVERILGNIIASSAGSQTIVISDLDLGSGNTLLENGNISWSYFPQNFSASAGLLSLNYNDTTNMTTYASFTIFNGSNTSQIIFNATSTSYDATFSYNTVSNTTYVSLFEYHNSLLDNPVVEWKTWMDKEYTFPVSKHLEAFDTGDGNYEQIKMYASLFFLTIWVLLFGSKHITWALASTLIWVLLLYWWDFFPISLTWLSIIGIVSITGIFVDQLSRRGGAQA